MRLERLSRQAARESRTRISDRALEGPAFDTRLRDIFSVQDEIANAIVAQLSPRLVSGRANAQITTAPPTEVIPAYELMLRGRYHLKRRDEAPIRRSIALFEQALELDPGFVEAYCDLARAYALLPYYSYEDRDEMFDQAIATIERGAATKPEVRDAAQDTLAFMHFGRWEWIEAEEGYRKALAAQSADPNLHQWYSQLLASVGKSRESLKHAQLAHKLDVLSPVVNDRLAVGAVLPSWPYSFEPQHQARPSACNAQL